MRFPSSKSFTLSILAPVLGLSLVLSGGCGGDDDDGVTIDGPRPDAPPGADAGDTPDAPATCTVPASYTAVADPAGTFFANFDDNGSGPGDPIVGNDTQLISGVLQAGAPLDLIFITLTEGVATFTDEVGGVRDFGSFKLPLSIDIGATPLEQDYDTCGACVSILHDVTVVDGEVDTYQVQLVAQAGTFVISSLPTQEGDTFTGTLQDVELAQIDINGDLVPAGCQTTVSAVDVTAVMAAP